MDKERWVRIKGEGLVYSGPCIVYDIVFVPDTGNDYVDIYDGRDITTGKMFCRLQIAAKTTHHVNLGQGVPFHMGIYVVDNDGGSYTTVSFIPCD